ncbi:MAG: FkbM family methyltransferase [Methylococcaceae bacterium]
MRDIKQLVPPHRMIEGRHGIFIYNMHDHYLGLALEYYGECCEHEIELFRQLIQPNSVVWDIGANIGVLTIPLARFVGHQGHVIAFEPQPEVFHLLSANIAVNALNHVRAMPFALSNEQGILNIPAVDYSRSGNFGGISFLNAENYSNKQVECRKIDDLSYLPLPNFIKIDVEGMELLVLQGGIHTIKKSRPVIYCENDRIEKSENLIAYLWSLDYRLYWHIPPLYNPNNYFNYSSNIYNNVHSFNMLCMPKELNVSVALPEIHDKLAHPLKQ